jgi:hypothetical protein
MIKKICVIIFIVVIFIPGFTFAEQKNPPRLDPATCWDADGHQISCPDRGQYDNGRICVTCTKPRFVDNGDQTITDNLTGLIWSKDAYAPGPGPCAPSTDKAWLSAVDYVHCLNEKKYLGFSDWRLPTMKELEIVADTKRKNPFERLNVQGFKNVKDGYYWSATNYEYGRGQAWVVSMSGGSVYGGIKTDGYYVWLVRNVRY